MAVGGFDPSGSWIGWARLDAPTEGRLPEHPPPLELGAIRGSSDDGKVKGELARVVRLFGPADRLLIEVVPKKLKKSQHASHYSSAPVAWWGGVVDGMAWFHGVDSSPMEISTWRRAMLQASVQWGSPLGRPRARGGAMMASNRVASTSRLEGGLLRLTRACGHTHEVASTYFLELGAPTCPQCHRAQATKASAQAQRDAWKATAVAFVRAFWPDELQPLVDRARARARNKDQADHTLSGVADACEAVGIAMGHWGK